MRFFSVYDLVQSAAHAKGHSLTDMYRAFRKAGVGKAQLMALSECGVLPTDERVLAAIVSYTKLSPIELELSMGRIPAGYEEAFLKNVGRIGSILESHGRTDTPSPIDVEPYFTTEFGRLYQGDCLALFPVVLDGSVDCVFADPPYNLNKEYDEGVDDGKSFSQYIDWCVRWVEQCVRVLKPGGSLFIYNLPKWNTYVADYLNGVMSFRDWITVDMKFGLPLQGRLYPAHYSLLYYVKGPKPAVFNPQRVPMPTCRHCGGELRDYGGYKDKMNPQGVNLSDVWSDIYPVRHDSSKTRKYNELSVKFMDRIITMATNEGDVVLDPFGGSGSTYAVAELLGRKWVGFELGDCDTIKARLLNKANDKRLLKKVYEEKDILFPEAVRTLRKKNGFWLEEDVRKDESGFSQLSILEPDSRTEG